MINEKDFDFHSYLINHAEELKKFSKDVNILSVSALTQLQRLPISLRRRAASHNIKRLPHRFQKLAKVVAASKVVKKCRKYRRRHLSLKDIYMKRQIKNKWLYTHIWHAKRFKLTNKWGWRIPYEPAQKCFRPCTKAMKNGCCVIDLSYFCTLEICGKFDKIIKYLAPLLANGGSESLNRRIKEGKEISLILYKPNLYPHGPICPFKILRISSEHAYGSSVLISIHPSARDEVISVFGDAFSFKEIHPNCWINRKKIVLRDRTGELCRFRLLGQLSQPVLTSLLDNQNEFFKALISVPLSSIPRELAFETTISDLNSKRPLLKQTDICQRKTLPQNFMPNTNLSLSKFQSSPDILTALRIGEMSDLVKLLSFDLAPIKEADQCPILMSRVHYLDEKAPGGWEIIVPAKWAMSMWMTLIMKGCKSMGVRYWSRFCAIEATSLLSKYDCFPLFGWPDTLQGSLSAEEENQRQISQWKRRPPAKRVNFTNGATKDPFICPWASLLSSDQQFFVNRDLTFLFRIVSPILQGKVKISLEELHDYSPDAQRALIPVILDCPASAASSNAVIMAAEFDDVFSSSLEQPIGTNANSNMIRPIIGFVEYGDQSMSIGKGRGFGFVSLYQLVRLCPTHQPCRKVWFKNTNTRRFVPGILNITI